jgi:phenylpyruvate tautomerase PptA (4-oxalocrotonate tautomerase family)
MPIIHVYSTEGWLSPERKKLMIDKITDAVVEAEGQEYQALIPPDREP